MSDHDWVELFTREFDQPESVVQARIWADVLGDEYPAELAPYSYTTRSELQVIAAALAVGSGDLLVDIGCGRGGPGLWVTATTGARYVGVDIAVSALDAVARRAESLGLGARVRTIEGSFDSLPLDDGEADAVMSVDSLLFAPDKPAAAAEMARVLRPGGRLVATTWDYHAQPVGRPPQVSDHRPLLADVGLQVEVYDETVDWDQRQRAIAEQLLDSVDELANESGEDPAMLRQGIEEMAATQDTMSRRVLIVARRR
jgi:SAM-dependent methyltransferase